MYNTIKKGQVVILKANFALRMKVGRGGIAPKLFLACRRVMEENAFDFAPMARDILKTIQSVTERMAAGKIPQDEALESLRVQIMQFKANAATFRYPLLSEIAQKLQVFLDEINELDAPALEIIAAFHNTAERLLASKEDKFNFKRALGIPAEFEKAFERYRSLKSRRQN